MTLPPTGLSNRPTEYALCRACAAVWETFPQNWCEDVVGALPCDNCAFRSGSPEQADREKWGRLIDHLRGGAEFKCHKGAPILGLTGPGEKNIRFDEVWIQHRARTCAGFIRMVRAMSAKGEDWPPRRYGLGAAPDHP